MLLIIIEAPKKIETVKLAAKNVWGRDIDVFATGGYIKTFPSHVIGIDVSTFEPDADVYTKNGLYFTENIAKVYKEYGEDCPWEKVFLMTDPDREGEGIAMQALLELKKWFPRVPTERLYTHELTVEGLSTAEHRSEPHSGMVSAQKARRVLDRLLPLSAGQFLGRGTDYRGLGRVQLAAVNVLKKTTSSWKRFSLAGSWKTKDGTFRVEQYSDNVANLQKQLQTIKTASAWKNASITTSIETILPPPPHSAITLMAALGNILPEDTMAAAQDSYAKGRLSYPRTDQTLLGLNGRHAVASLIDSLHLGARLKSDWHQSNDDLPHGGWVQGAHPALHPQYGWLPDENLLEPTIARVENEVAAAAMGSLMVPAVFKITRATIDADTDWLTAVKKEIIEPGWTLAYTRLGLENPLSPKPVFGQRYPRIKEAVPTPAKVVQWLSEANLGRPSTLAGVPTRLQYLGLLSGLCVPTSEAEQTVQEVSKYMPRLTDPGFTTLMEKGLLHLIDNPSDYQNVVKSLLVEAGTDLISLGSLIANVDEFDINGKLDEMLDSAFYDNEL